MPPTCLVDGLAALGRRYPLYRGHGWLARSVFPDPGADGAAVEVKLRSGPGVLVHPDEFIGRIVFYFGDLDPRISWICRKLLGPGDTVVDVGANYGVVSLLAAKLVGSTGVVHACEPQPGVADLLRRSTVLNRFTQLRVHQVALSDADGSLELHIPDGHLGGASLDRVAGPGTTIDVPVRHAGSFLDDLGLRAIRVLKVDIEGHEAAFLRGGRDFLRRCPPDVILLESNDALYDDGEPVPFWEREPVRELSDLGYDLVRIGDGLATLGARLSWVTAGADDAGLDFVAVHRPKHREVASLLGIS